MTKKDLDEIFSCQLFGWRFTLFATAALNFFLPPLIEVRSVAGGITFTAWEWVVGYSATVNGVEVFKHEGSLAMLAAFGFIVLGGVFSVVRTRKATFLAALFAALAAWLAWEQISAVAKLATANTVRGFLEIGVGAAKGWILIPLMAAIVTCGYAVFGADQSVMFGPQARDED